MTDQIGNMSQEEFEEQLVTVPRGEKELRSGGRRGRPATKPKARSAPVHKVNITAKIEAWILLGNSIAAVVPQIREDLLDGVEIHAMAEALNAVAQENTMVYKALDNIVSSGSYIQLAMVIGLIGARRAARHGIIPEQMDQIGAVLLSGNPADMMDIMNSAANIAEDQNDE